MAWFVGWCVGRRGEWHREGVLGEAGWLVRGVCAFAGVLQKVEL